jgi:hypothetical protein
MTLMNTLLLLLSLVGSTVLVVLTLLSVAGYILRCDLTRMRATGSSTPQLTRDPLGLKNVLVEFFGHSKGSARMIRLLAARKKPIGYLALVDDVRFDEKWRRESDALTASAILAVLGIMQVARVVRVTEHGFSITDVGREVHRRIESATRRPESPPPATHSVSKDSSRPGATFASAEHTIPEENRRRTHPMISR